MVGRGVAARWFGKIAMVLSTTALIDFLTIIRILSCSLAGEWQENAAPTLLPWDQHPEIFTTLAQLCALGSKFYPQRYPQGSTGSGGGSVCADQHASVER